jgi:prepilin-type N-terminal cleavage/methylation domain-containing protein
MTKQTQIPASPSPAPPYRALGRHRAFTIIEVLVAMGILAIGIASVFTLLPVAALIQKQAVDAAQGPEFGNSVLATLQTTASSSDACFGTPSTAEPIYRSLYTAMEAQRFTLNNTAGQLYNYQIVFRRLVANGPVEIAILVYRKLPAEEQGTPATALKTIVTSASTPSNVYGFTEPVAQRGLVLSGVSISPDQAIPGNLFLVGNASSNYYVVKYVGADTSVAGYSHRISPVPPVTCEEIIGLKKNPTTDPGSLTCVAIATGVIK